MIVTITIDTEKPIDEQIKKQLPKPTYIIKKEDIGKGRYFSVKINGFNEYPFEPLGKVLECDFGKMCVKNGEHWQVENDEQFNKRINKK